MTALPSGIVTFLFTDIEGSSRLWERDRQAMARAAARHDMLLTGAIASQNGVLFKHVGDMVQAAFHRPLDGVLAAVAAQQALAAEPWPETGPIRVRMGLHLGDAAPNARGDYNQIACLNRLARLMSAGHGGQVLLSDAVRQAISGQLPAGVMMRGLGRHRLRDLLEPEQISQLVISGLPADFPPLKSLEGHPTNLPTLAAPLLGREAETAGIVSLLSGMRPRMLTLAGPGGVGKTHLAIQAAADLLDRFPEGVWFVPLGEVTDPEMIVPAMAAAVGVREGGGLSMREALLHWIGNKRMLFVIDNMEQVIAGAPAVAALLAACPRLRLLATSRQRLSIGGERVFPVQPLPFGTRESAALRLFAERARDVSPGFTLDAKSTPMVAAICARLDGLPLAIELAAAQLRTRTLAEVLADLESRFDLLVGGRRDSLRHQHSLEATIAWSYERLDPSSQRLVRLLATFAGGWNRDAALAVAGDVDNAPDRLGGLVEQSLVRREAGPDDVSRWSMLESIRAFARERLQDSGEQATAANRHAAWCLSFAEQAAAHLVGAAQEFWLAQIDREYANARAALQWWDSTGEAGQTLALATALAPYWQVRGSFSEGRAWLETSLHRADLSTPAGLAAMVEAGVLAHAQGDFPGARSFYQRALSSARASGDRGREAALLNNLGAIALEQGHIEEATRHCTESLRLAEAIGDQRRRADVLVNLGAAEHYRGNIEGALSRYLECYQIWTGLNDKRGMAEMLLNILLLLAPRPEETARARGAGNEALRLYRELGDPQGEAHALAGLGIVASTARELAQATELHEESLRIARESDDRISEVRALGNLASIENDRGVLDRAEALLREFFAIIVDLGDLDGLASGLEIMAAILAERGQNDLAVRQLGAAHALRGRIDVETPPEGCERLTATAGTLARRLGGRFDALFAAGAALAPEEAVAEALAHGENTSQPTSLAASFERLDGLLALAPAIDAEPPSGR